VIVWLPTASVEVVKVALPPANVRLAIVTPPSRKVTVPVAVPAPGATALTVAVNVTSWPNTVGFTEEVTVVVLESLLTVWVMGADVLELKLLSPE
jgi:hypothetical protein